jgi:type III pantothenate kinase
MNLALDFGNTRIKAGLFRDELLIDTHVFDSPQQLLNSLDLFAQVKKCIVGSVTRQHEDLLGLLPPGMNPRVFTHTMRTPFENLYQSALTLGSDRVAASAGSHLLYPGKNVLTIDAGTCIKYNFVNAGDQYLGGAISPGIRMRLAAMSHYTSALPLTEPEPDYGKLTGSSTRESLLSGAMVAAACEIEGMTERYALAHSDLHVVLTGGDADYLSTQLKSRFFAHPHLVLSGLNRLLMLNSGH